MPGEGGVVEARRERQIISVLKLYVSFLFCVIPVILVCCFFSGRFAMLFVIVLV